jgi:hypothetical protein
MTAIIKTRADNQGYLEGFIEGLVVAYKRREIINQAARLNTYRGFRLMES